MSEWKPIDSAPESTPILVWVPKVNQGLDSAEVVRVFRHDGEMYFWTNGGPNGGDDLHFEEAPTHWMPLPEPPQ